mmetsp:Transcript_21067/g.33035  ORF Transcript_21067/g.33035 Transcript_21067/m.33035 type:complete len:106 (+) Transcript_21067:178-495(+)
MIAVIDDPTVAFVRDFWLEPSPFSSATLFGILTDASTSPLLGKSLCKSVDCDAKLNSEKYIAMTTRSAAAKLPNKLLMLFPPVLLQLNIGISIFAAAKKFTVPPM